MPEPVHDVNHGQVRFQVPDIKAAEFSAVLLEKQIIMSKIFIRVLPYIFRAKGHKSSLGFGLWTLDSFSWPKNGWSGS